MINWTSLTHAQVEDLVRGCAFMGTGGGGSPLAGKSLLEQCFKEGKEIKLVHPESIPDDAFICTGSYIGSIAPRTADDMKIIKKLGLKQRISREIVEAVKELEVFTDTKIAAIAPCELGGLNTTCALDAAANLNILAVDGDFAGRALPETIQFRFCIAGMDIWPRVICDYAGNKIIIKEAVTPPMMERIQKHIAMSSFGLVGAAGHLMRAKDMKRVIIPQTISHCIKIGEVIRKARSDKDNFPKSIANALGGWVLFSGKVRRKTWEDKDGYMVGEIGLEGEGEFESQSFRMWFKNEYHLSWLNEKPFVTSPDIISVVNLKSGEVPTNTDVSLGDHLGIIGFKAAEGYRSPDALKVLSPRYFGFDLNYLPIEDFFNEK
jgi:DUF917 family protein